MLDDFGRSGAGQARGRFGTSLLLSVMVCGAGGAAIVHATARVQTRLEADDEGRVKIPRSLLPHSNTPAPAKIDPPVPRSRKHASPTPRALPQRVAPESDSELPPEEPEPTLDARPPIDEVPVTIERARDSQPPAPAPVIKPVASPENRYSRLNYPPRALRNGVQGVVTVQFDVLEDGSVANAHIIDGPSELHEVVLEAARRWRFTPARQGGKTVRYTRMIQRIVFRLEDA